MSSNKIYIITDIENLFYDYVNYYLDILSFIPSFLHENFGINKDQFLEGYINTIEISTTPQDDYVFTTYKVLKLMDKNFMIKNTSKNAFINSLRQRFYTVRQNLLSLLPNSISVLKTLKDNNFVVVGLSNSTSKVLKQRIKMLKLDKFFDIIYCLEDEGSGFHFESDDSSISSIWLSTMYGNVSSLMCDFVELPKTYEKPSTRGIRRIIQDEDINKENIFVIGTSLENDILPAKVLELKTILVDRKIKIRNRNMLFKLSRRIGAKRLRQLLNIYNNNFVSELKPSMVVSSLLELQYSLEKVNVI
ncbi:MAG: HAD family hydrolase [Brevinematia bacterium]